MGNGEGRGASFQALPSYQWPSSILRATIRTRKSKEPKINITTGEPGALERKLRGTIASRRESETGRSCVSYARPHRGQRLWVSHASCTTTPQAGQHLPSCAKTTRCLQTAQVLPAIFTAAQRPSAATRPAGRHVCNRDAMAGLDKSNNQSRTQRTETAAPVEP